MSNEKKHLEALSNLDKKKNRTDSITIKISEDIASTLEMLMDLMEWNLQTCINSAIAYSLKLNRKNEYINNNIKHPLVDIKINLSLKNEKRIKKCIIKPKSTNLEKISLIVSDAINDLNNSLRKIDANDAK